MDCKHDVGVSKSSATRIFDCIKCGEEYYPHEVVILTKAQHQLMQDEPERLRSLMRKLAVPVDDVFVGKKNAGALGGVLATLVLEGERNMDKALDALDKRE